MTRFRLRLPVMAAILLVSAMVLFRAGTFDRLFPPEFAGFFGDGDAFPPAPVPPTSFGAADAPPAQLNNEEFWRMIAEFSEPAGSFIYDNYLSNEQSYQDVVPELRQAVPAGRVYIGVGPEQNFTYIAATRPRLAFIIDIRRENMIAHLMYKALFEMSANRADFVGLLFSRPSPPGLDEGSSAGALFRAYDAMPPEAERFAANLAAIRNHLTVVRALPLSEPDLEVLEDTYNVFFALGPRLSYSSLQRGPAGPTYEALMTLSAADGRNWSYLATEDNFRIVAEMHRANLIVPIVGDFAGDKAMRTIGRYLMDHKATVGMFYVSNVEQYIRWRGPWRQFSRNVASLPVDSSSLFVRFVLPNYARYVPDASWGVMSVISRMDGFVEEYRGGEAPDYTRALEMSHRPR